MAKKYTEAQTFAADSGGLEKCPGGRHNIGQNYY